MRPITGETVEGDVGMRWIVALPPEVLGEADLAPGEGGGVGVYSRVRRVWGDDAGGSVDVGVGMGGLSSIEDTDSVLVEGTEDIDEVLEAHDERFGESNIAPTNTKQVKIGYCKIPIHATAMLSRHVNIQITC